jgi:hypothetical protein
MEGKGIHFDSLTHLEDLSTKGLSWCPLVRFGWSTRLVDHSVSMNLEAIFTSDDQKYSIIFLVKSGPTGCLVQISLHM